MNEPEFQEMTVFELVKGLERAFQSADIDPSRDSVITAVDKFGKSGFRHLILYLENGGFLCLCSDPKMSRKLHDAIALIDDELDAEEAQGSGL